MSEVTVLILLFVGWVIFCWISTGWFADLMGRLLDKFFNKTFDEMPDDDEEDNK